MAEMTADNPRAPDAPKVTVYFNPFAFTVEQNNEFLRLGYEPLLSMPADRMLTRKVEK